MQLLLLLFCLAPQTQNAEAKKILDALAPPLKDPSYSQIEWESGPVKWVGHLSRQKAWRLDRTADGREVSYLFDGKEFLEYKKYANSFRRTKGESLLFLLMVGGGLAEIHYSGNADRLLKDAKQVTLKKEKLADVDCSHVTIFKKDLYSESEFHFWIDADKNCKRFLRKVTVQGKTNELTWTYKVVDPPTTTEETFTIQLPADAKDLNAKDK
jgi:hypothetical protein